MSGLSAEVIVVGAGHAGCEAALAAARLGRQVLLISMNPNRAGFMPCNPSIGGPGKGQLVREIDALGGEMGRAADASTLQVRRLNTGKGAAVQTLRAVCDKGAYSSFMVQALASQDGISVLDDEVLDLEVRGGRLSGCWCREAGLVQSAAMIVTAGTYLASEVFVGDERRPGGPAGLRQASALSAALAKTGVTLRRFKTGTSPRVALSSLDFGAMAEIVEEPEPAEWRGFCFSTVARQVPARSTWLTRSTPETQRIVAAHLKEAAMFSGAISGKGPRYCPSIEAKVAWFPHHQQHQIFVEPESASGDIGYLAGLSTSLPAPVQVEVVRSVPGLESAEILAPGYAIEYDCLCPHQLWRSLECRQVAGLYFAGQVNGSSGYEEAAAQGLIAGINAARAVVGVEPVVLGREQAYIGVLVDDLVTRGAEEPYRMMTGRAERRLLLRHDNADLRLVPVGAAVGLVDPMRAEEVATIADRIERAIAQWRAGQEPDLPADPVVAGRVAEQLAVVRVYAGYLDQEERLAARLQGWSERRLPAVVDYAALPSLTSEARERLAAALPETLGQAARLPGVTPGDLLALGVWLRKQPGEPISGRKPQEKVE